MALIEIVLTPEGQINLILPTRFTDLCPGKPGQLRHFRVVAIDWYDAWALVEQLYQRFSPLKHSFDDVVLLTIPAVRLIPDDLTFYLTHRGRNPLVWEQVKLAQPG
jgi:hypothetical protein